MLVDGAIVLVEFADRKMAEGLPKRDAYRAAATRMAWPITARCRRRIVRLPAADVLARRGRRVHEVPADHPDRDAAAPRCWWRMVFMPVLGSVFGKARRDGDHDVDADPRAGPCRRPQEVRGSTGRYVRLRRLGARPSGEDPAVAASRPGAVYVAYVMFGNGVEFFPEVEPQTSLLQIHGRGNLSIEERDALVREVEARSWPCRPSSTSSRPSMPSPGCRGDVGGQDLAEDVIGTINIEFANWDAAPPGRRDHRRDRSSAPPASPASMVERASEEAGPPTGKPIQVQFSSRDPGLLEPAVGRAPRPAGRRWTAWSTSRTAAPLPGIEWQIDVDRAQAAKLRHRRHQRRQRGPAGHPRPEVRRLPARRQRRRDRHPSPASPTSTAPSTQLDRLRVTTPRAWCRSATSSHRAGQAEGRARINRVDGQRVLNVQGRRGAGRAGRRQGPGDRGLAGAGRRSIRGIDRRLQGRGRGAGRRRRPS